MVGTLLEQGGSIAFIEATKSIYFDDLVHSVEKVTILWSLLQLIMDKLGLDSLLRGHNEGTLHGTSDQTITEVVHSSLLSEAVGSGILESSESHVVLWN